MQEFNGLLTAAILIPILGSILIAIFLSGKIARTFAVCITLTELILTSYIFLYYRQSEGGYQLIDRIDWIPIDSFNAEYFLAIDGLSAPLVLLTGILGVVAVFASWNVTNRIKEHFMWLIALQGAVIGVFTPMDFFLFFI